MLVSAIVTGGLGPWLPYQIFAAGWVGLGAGLLSGGLDRRPTRRDFVVLAAYGLLAGFAFGAVMDLWDWAFFQGAPDLGYVAGLGAAGTIARFGQFYLLTSAGYDAFRAVGNAAMILALGPPVLASLARLRARASFSFVGAAPGSLRVRRRRSAPGRRPPRAGRAGRSPSRTWLPGWPKREPGRSRTPSASTSSAAKRSASQPANRPARVSSG